MAKILRTFSYSENIKTHLLKTTLKSLRSKQDVMEKSPINLFILTLAMKITLLKYTK